jgi:hypothetical protein
MTATTVGRFIVHAAAATVGSFIAGFVVTEILHPSGIANFWFDTPYGPSFWGTALVFGFCLNLAMDDRSAKWAWAVGLLWLALWCGVTVAEYGPQWTHGRSLGQELWSEYFSYWHCSEECLTQMFVTTPTINSMAYSVGAAIALPLRTHLLPFVDNRFALVRKRLAKVGRYLVS